MALLPISNCVRVISRRCQKEDEKTYSVWVGDGPSKVNIDGLEDDRDALSRKHGLCALLTAPQISYFNDPLHSALGIMGLDLIASSLDDCLQTRKIALAGVDYKEGMLVHEQISDLQ